MGCCVKYCLPRRMRSDGGDHTGAPMRRKHSVADTSLPVHRKLYDDVVDFVCRYNIDNVVFLDTKTTEALGAKKAYEYAAGAVVMTISCKKSAGAQGDKINARNGYGNESYGTISAEQTALAHFSGFARLDAARIIDDYGYKTLNSPEVDTSAYLKAAGIQPKEDEITITEVLLTNAPFSSYEYYDLNEPCDNLKLSLTENICSIMDSEGSETYAIVPAERMDKLSTKLIPIKGGEGIIDMASKTPRFHIFEPDVKSYTRKIYKTSDHLANARNVIIMGIHYPEIVQKMTIKPPAFAVGPYMYSKYETTFELAYTAFRIEKYLQGKGYNAVATYNLTGIGGDMGTPRGLLPDAFCNQLEAAQAGLGALTVNGMCYTGEHGFSQDFIAIVTDAPLDEVVKAKGTEAQSCCEGCDICIRSCPAKALREKNAVNIELAGVKYKWIPTDGKACDWSKKYALCGEEGHRYTGSDSDFEVPESITEENLAETMKKADRILSYRPTTVHRCVIECPLVHKK